MNIDLLSILLSYQFIILSLAISAITYVMRNILEFFFQVNEKKLYNDLLLPCIPIIIGTLIGLISTKFPFPEQIISISARCCFGSVAGLLSAQIYRLVKSQLPKTE